MSRGRVVAEFRERFGREPDVVAVAPGRVNLIGEHTDYNGGFVFPAAINQELWLAAAVANTTELHSLELGAAEPFDTATVEPKRMGWATYPAGTAWAFREAGYVVPNLVGVVGSSVLIGAGVSSSAAIEMAFAVVWDHLLGLDLAPLELARLGQRCENGFLGLQSGLMDQMASACGVRGHALLFDTLNATTEAVRLPESLQVVICDTGASRELASSKYNERRAECELVCQTLNVPNLRVLDRSRLEQGKAELPEVAYRRARHVLTENERCLEFAQVLRRDEPTDALINSSVSALRRDEPTDALMGSNSSWGLLGVLMRQSHESLRDDYEVTGLALDRMAEACWASPGCVGARMTGAGFGGACVALVERDSLGRFIESAQSAFGPEGRFTPCEIVDGARVVT